MIIEALQNFKVYVKAEKNRENTEVTITYFEIMFNGSGATVIGTTSDEDDIPDSTTKRPVTEEEKDENALNICYRHNKQCYTYVGKLIKDTEAKKSEFPHGDKIKNQLNYLSDVKMHYYNWFNKNSIPIPVGDRQLSAEQNPRGDYSELILDGEYFEVRNEKVKGFIQYIFDEYDDEEYFNGTEVVKKYYALKHFRGKTNFYRLFNDAGEQYVILKEELFLPKAHLSREYRINPIYLISS